MEKNFLHRKIDDYRANMNPASGRYNELPALRPAASALTTATTSSPQLQRRAINVQNLPTPVNPRATMSSNVANLSTGQAQNASQTMTLTEPRREVYYDKFSDCKKISASVQIVIYIILFVSLANIVFMYNIFNSNTLIMTRLFNIFIFILSSYAAYKLSSSSCFSIFDNLNVQTHDVITETSQMYFNDRSD